jgi:PPOX class probable F420-dependent enzyme
MASLELLRKLASADRGLAVAVTIRGDGTPQASVVNAGVLDHPLDGRPVVGLVARGQTAKLANLRARPYASVTFRAGWEWVVAEGPVQLAGPDDGLEGLSAEDVRLLLRAVFAAAGGTHDDLDAYDRVMAEERRTVVLVRPDRIISNPTRAQHIGT